MGHAHTNDRAGKQKQSTLVITWNNFETAKGNNKTKPV